MKGRRLLMDRLTPEEILLAFTESHEWLSRREIARALGVSKSDTLIHFLEQMVADGLLYRQETVTINRAPIFMYRRT